MTGTGARPPAAWSVTARRRLPAQDVVEYGLLIAVIALVVLLASGGYGRSVSDWLGRLSGRVTTVGTLGSAACNPPPGAQNASEQGLQHGQAFQCPNP